MLETHLQVFANDFTAALTRPEPGVSFVKEPFPRSFPETRPAAQNSTSKPVALGRLLASEFCTRLIEFQGSLRGARSKLIARSRRFGESQKPGHRRHGSAGCGLLQGFQQRAIALIEK